MFFVIVALESPSETAAGETPSEALRRALGDLSQVMRSAVVDRAKVSQMTARHGGIDITGHFRNLNWRYLLYIRPMYKGISPQNMASKMVQYLHVRILKFPLMIW